MGKNSGLWLSTHGHLLMGDDTSKCILDLICIINYYYDGCRMPMFLQVSEVKKSVTQLTKS